ncbi:MAG: Inositol transport system permease protein, partial [uncultured Quadrisphaera sp.]
GHPDHRGARAAGRRAAGEHLAAAQGAHPPRARGGRRGDRRAGVLPRLRPVVPDRRGGGERAGRRLAAGDHGRRRGAADDRRGVRPLRRRADRHLGAVRHPGRLPAHAQRVGRGGAGAGAQPAHRRPQRGAAAEDPAAQLHRHPGHLLRPAGPEPGGDEAGHRHRAGHRRLGAGRLGLGARGLRQLAEPRRGLGADQRAVVAAAGGRGHRGAHPHPRRQLDLRRRGRPQRRAAGGGAGGPGEDRPVHGRLAVRLAGRHDHHGPVGLGAGEPGHRPGVRVHHRRGDRRVPAHRRLRLGRRRRPGGPDLRDDQAGHPRGPVGQRLVQALPRRDAARRDRAERPRAPPGLRGPGV